MWPFKKQIQPVSLTFKHAKDLDMTNINSVYAEFTRVANNLEKRIAALEAAKSN